jgi:hypothetical protein
MSTAACVLTRPAVGVETVYWAEGLADLVAVFEPEVQILVHPRPPDPQIAAYLDLANSWRLGYRRVLDNAQSLAGSGPAAPTWPDLPGREALLADIRHLSEVYRDLLDCERLGLRFESLDRAMCPGFHRDHTGIRLVCTYRGPGTEWLDDAGLDPQPCPSPGARPSFAAPAEASAIGRAPAFAVVLLKGTLWQGNAGRGAIHRSPVPPPGGGSRYLLALDALW